MSVKKLKIKKAPSKNVDDIYQKMEHKIHIYEKPDTYVGSCEKEEVSTFVFNDETSKIKMITTQYSPAWYKCFDELIVNAHDHKKRMDKVIKEEPKARHRKVTTISVKIDDDGGIEFYNDGDGIHIEYLSKHKMYPAELIFGSLLSSTNFDDSQEREWGGRNGYGAKLANIFSTKFIVETVDHRAQKKLYQEFSNNMKIRQDPIITSVDKKEKPYTKITWYPDYERFGMSKDNPVLKNIILKRVYDIAGVTEDDIKVLFNGVRIKVKNFETYINMYVENDSKRAYQDSLGWQIAACSSEDDVFQHVSFVNGIYTSRGGTHVDYIANQIKTKLVEYFKKKKKTVIKPQIVKNQLKLFVNAYKIPNPSFDSQTKETLKTTKGKFRTFIEISDKFISELAKTDIVQKIINQSTFKDIQSLTKTDGKKTKRVKVPKLLDANKAGSKDSKKCTIILTEGDSAKTMAVAGLSEVGRDYYGVFPLRGKIQNIRNLASKKILNCQILNTIKTIIGLQSGKNYKKEYDETGKWPLRYGKVLLMTDQDHDGSHIKGLVMNIFDVLWGDLLEMGFVSSMITPIVKVFKKSKEIPFYTLQDYEGWKNENNSKGWRVKYYKGLGTSTSKEAKEYFRTLNIIKYLPEPDVPNKLDLAFNSERASDRKVWLGSYNKDVISDFSKDDLTFNDFVDKELIHFSNADNTRSLPCIMDGLKPSLRKVLFCAFKRKLTTEIKVAQLSGYTSEHSAYHHGEVSLEGTIKNMAQDFVGSNNVNYLEPIGQFGSRLQGGKDAAQSRYIFTKLNPITRSIFNEADDIMCKFLDDDGMGIEPEYYYPIIPTILVNGSQGIGTGYSTSIPMYNPMDICDYIKTKISNEESQISLKPWYRGFKGKIESTSKGSFITRGKFRITKNNTINITELPINVWTEKYIEILEKYMIDRTNKESAAYFIRDIKDDSTEDSVNITIKMNPYTISSWSNKMGRDGISVLENKLKLTSTISTSNIYAFDENLQIKKYTIDSIINDWYTVRKGIYVKRRLYLLEKLKKELDIIKYKTRFITEIVDDIRIINKKPKATIIQELKDSDYPKFKKSYDYLLKMDLYKLTYEEIESLKHKCSMKQAEYDVLYGKEPTQLWIDDLDSFTETWKKDLRSYNKLHDIKTPKPKFKIKKKLKT
tara:strand:+ start:245 stop:3718 length:3474 start_codon:yes stop_codon:yes gene_type:complete